MKTPGLDPAAAALTAGTFRQVLMSNNARGRLYVEKDVQRALVLQLFRHWLVFVAILSGTLLALESLGADPQQSLTATIQAVWNHYAPLYLVIAALFPVFAYDSIKLSNRFVGPIVRLRRTMRQAALGERVAPLQFRQGDFWQDMATTFNALVERLPADDEDRGPADATAADREHALAVNGSSTSSREI